MRRRREMFVPHLNLQSLGLEHLDSGAVTQDLQHQFAVD